MHNSYGLNGTRFSFKVDGHNPLQLSVRSVFCFQPIGDLMTRKGLFDSILLGCIPVVFDPLTAAVMYTWHWEEAFWKQVIVEFDFHPTAHRYFDPVEALVQLYTHNRSLVTRMQSLIRSRVFELQYAREGPRDVFQHQSPLQYLTLTQPNSSNPDQIHYELKQASSSSAVVAVQTHPSWPHCPITHKPLRDAYDVVMQLSLAWHSGQLVRLRNGTVPECWDGRLDRVLNRCVPLQPAAR